MSWLSIFTPHCWQHLRKVRFLNSKKMKKLPKLVNLALSLYNTMTMLLSTFTRLQWWYFPYSHITILFSAATQNRIAQHKIALHCILLLAIFEMIYLSLSLMTNTSLPITALLLASSDWWYSDIFIRDLVLWWSSFFSSNQAILHFLHLFASIRKHHRLLHLERHMYDILYIKESISEHFMWAFAITIPPGAISATTPLSSFVPHPFINILHHNHQQVHPFW